MGSLTQLHLLAGWTGMFAGVVSGAIIGLFFHKEAWMGGYGSYRRRLTRLGHISFFGLGFLNFLFALTLPYVDLSDAAARLASTGFLLGAASMPVCCFLSAWKKPMRHLFPLPVISISTAIVLLLVNWTPRDAASVRSEINNNLTNLGTAHEESSQ